MIQSRVETTYHHHTIVTEAWSIDDAIWRVKVTVLQDDQEGGTSVVKRLEPGESVTFRTSAGAARAGMLVGRAWIERREQRMTFVIIDRNRPELVEELANRFAGDPTVRIIFDRRIRLGASPVGERRWDEEGASAVLSNKGYISIRIE